MIYNNFNDKKLSALGLGCMRLPKSTPSDADIDVDATKAMVAFAFQNGINYFDTAWGYHEGNFETVMGEVLSAYPRDSFYLASKFPGYDSSLMDKVIEIFPKQLEKCKVDYFDFYMFHNVCEMNIDGYLDEKYGIFDYLMELYNEHIYSGGGFIAPMALEALDENKMLIVKPVKKYAHKTLKSVI